MRSRRCGSTGVSSNGSRPRATRRRRIPTAATAPHGGSPFAERAVVAAPDRVAPAVTDLPGPGHGGRVDLDTEARPDRQRRIPVGELERGRVGQVAEHLVTRGVVRAAALLLDQHVRYG